MISYILVFLLRYWVLFGQLDLFILQWEEVPGTGFDLTMLDPSDRKGTNTYVSLLLRIKRWGLSLHRYIFVHPPFAIFSREATSETYGPRVFFLIYLPLRSTLFSCIYFRSIKPKIQKYLATFYFYLFYLRSIYLSIYYKIISRPFAYLEAPYPERD